MTDIDLDHIERLANAATPGPWEHGGGDGLVWGPNIGDPVSGSTEPEDADFIAAAREAVPEMAAKIREQAAEIDRLREQLFAQKPVIDAAEAWAEERELDNGFSLTTEDALHDAIEQYRLMDHALTTARQVETVELPGEVA